MAVRIASTQLIQRSGKRLEKVNWHMRIFELKLPARQLARFVELNYAHVARRPGDVDAFRARERRVSTGPTATRGLLSAANGGMLFLDLRSATAPVAMVQRQYYCEPSEEKRFSTCGVRIANQAAIFS